MNQGERKPPITPKALIAPMPPAAPAPDRKPGGMDQNGVVKASVQAKATDRAAIC